MDLKSLAGKLMLASPNTRGAFMCELEPGYYREALHAELKERTCIEEEISAFLASEEDRRNAEYDQIIDLVLKQDTVQGKLWAIYHREPVREEEASDYYRMIASRLGASYVDDLLAQAPGYKREK